MLIRISSFYLVKTRIDLAFLNFYHYMSLKSEVRNYYICCVDYLFFFGYPSLEGLDFLEKLVFLPFA